MIDQKKVPPSSEEAGSVIDEWVRREGALNHAPFLGKHKLLVLFTKRLIFFLAFLLVVAVMLWPFLVPEEKRFQLVFSSIGKQEEEGEGGAQTNAMLKPRFHGVDSNNQPYNVVADQAVQQDEDTVLLTNVSGDITLNDTRWYAVSAREGVIHIAEKKLELTENVSLFTDNGFEVHTLAAQADIGKGTAQGDNDVEVQGPLGHLEAKGFKILNRGDEIYFTGPVRMTIYTHR
jgi:lipopolysaccharide export system protein LptC